MPTPVRPLVLIAISAMTLELAHPAFLSSSAGQRPVVTIDCVPTRLTDADEGVVDRFAMLSNGGRRDCLTQLLQAIRPERTDQAEFAARAVAAIAKNTSVGVRCL